MTVPPPPWRVVIASRISPVVHGVAAVLREAGHEPVAVLASLHYARQYGSAEDVGELVHGCPPGLDFLAPATRGGIAPLLEAVRPDLVVCMGFSWRVPPDALAVPRLGWLNGHPSLLPRHRGPTPLAWAIRDGDPEAGISWHRMDAELDTGPVLAQASYALGEPGPPEELYGRTGELMLETLAEALARLAAGEEGTPQAGGDYQSFFTAEDARLDLSRPADELHRLVWAWRYAFAPGVTRGALLDLDGEVVRVLGTSLTEQDWAQRVECGDGPLWVLETEPLGEAVS